jgi:hypothetical protein
MLGQILVPLEGSERAEQALPVAARPPLTGIASTTKVCYGFPAQQVMGTAESHGSDLIVLCSHGRTGLARQAAWSTRSSIRAPARRSCYTSRRQLFPSSQCGRLAPSSRWMVRSWPRPRVLSRIRDDGFVWYAGE